MREDIISFLRDPGRTYPFYVEMTGISYCDGTYRITRTDSSVSVFEYVLAGRGTVTVNGHTFAAAQGDTYLLHRGSSHSYQSDSADPWVKVWMNVGGPVVDSLTWNYGLGAINLVTGLDLKPLFDRVLEEARAAHGDCDAFFPGAALLFHQMAQRISEVSGGAAPARSLEAARMKLWLDRHITGRTTVAETAAQIYRSPSQAIRIFKKEYGLTPVDYLLGRRVETAMMLLKNTGMTAKEIAYRLSFADEHYFSNTFKKRTGLSPAEFRRK